MCSADGLPALLALLKPDGQLHTTSSYLLAHCKSAYLLFLFGCYVLYAYTDTCSAPLYSFDTSTVHNLPFNISLSSLSLLPLPLLPLPSLSLLPLPLSPQKSR